MVFLASLPQLPYVSTAKPNIYVLPCLGFQSHWVIIIIITIILFENAIAHYNTCVPLSDSLSISSFDGRTPTQKKLSDTIEEMQFNSLLNSCSLADKAQCQTELCEIMVGSQSLWMEIQWFVPYVPNLHLTLWVTTVSHAREEVI